MVKRAVVFVWSVSRLVFMFNAFRDGLFEHFTKTIEDEHMNAKRLVND